MILLPLVGRSPFFPDLGGIFFTGLPLIMAAFRFRKQTRVGDEKGGPSEIRKIGTGLPIPLSLSLSLSPFYLFVGKTLKVVG